MPNTIEVSQFEQAEAYSPDSITSGGLYPCIAVGFYDKVLKKVYLIHESNASMNQGIPGYIKHVLTGSESKNLKIYVTGACILDGDTDEDIQYVMNDRDYVQTLLNEVFMAEQISYEWPPFNVCVEMTISAQTGECQEEHH